MIIAQIIAYLVSAVWFLIPIKQIRTNYFFYFTVYAISSGLSLFNEILLIHPAKIYLAQGFLLIFSLYDFKKTPHYLFIIVVILTASILLTFIISAEVIIFILIIQHAFIFFLVLKKAILYSTQFEKLNLFHFVILLFEISVITRFLVIIGDIKTGIIYFYLTAAFGILIGIYFLFFNENNSFKFSLSKELL